jgi:hypothetical protein
VLPRRTAVDIRRAFPASREGWIEMVISAPKVGHVAHGGKAKGESASSKAAAVLQRQRQQQQQQRRSSSSGGRSSRCVSVTEWARSAIEEEGGGVWKRFGAHKHNNHQNPHSTHTRLHPSLRLHAARRLPPPPLPAPHPPPSPRCTARRGRFFPKRK